MLTQQNQIILCLFHQPSLLAHPADDQRHLGHGQGCRNRFILPSRMGEHREYGEYGEHGKHGKHGDVLQLTFYLVLQLHLLYLYTLFTAFIATVEKS